MAGDVAEFRELAVVAHGEDQVAVGDGERLVRTMFWCALPARAGARPVTR
jgi:hypothetical protein